MRRGLKLDAGRDSNESHRERGYARFGELRRPTQPDRRPKDGVELAGHKFIWLSYFDRATAIARRNRFSASGAQ